MSIERNEKIELLLKAVEILSEALLHKESKMIARCIAEIAFDVGYEECQEYENSHADRYKSFLPEYRDVTQAHVELIGKQVEVSDYPAGPWMEYTLLRFIDPNSKIGETGYRFETDGCLNWKYARIKIGGDA